MLDVEACVDKAFSRITAFASDSIQWILQKAGTDCVTCTTSEGAWEKRYVKKLNFWTSYTATAIYSILVLSALFQTTKLLYGILLVAVSQVSWVVLKWAMYILDDREIYMFVAFIKSWLCLVLEQGDKILSGQDAMRMVVAGAMLKAMPTGLGYARLVIHWKMQSVRQDMIAELQAEDRFDRSRLQNAFHLMAAPPNMKSAMNDLHNNWNALSTNAKSVVARSTSAAAARR